MGARDLGPDDLVWDHFSRPRDEDVVARIHAAADAGYAGIGLFLGAWAKLRDHDDALDRIDAALDETGMSIVNIETARGWAGGDVEGCRRQADLAFEIADRYGCRYLQVIGDAPGALDVATAAQGFGDLCDRAADHGLLIGLEWVPQMTNVETATQALQVVEAADRANGGFCFDAWHLTRSTNDVEELRALPGERIAAAQWSDGPLVPDVDDYYTDTTSNRVPPGSGEFRLLEMVRVLDEIGSEAPTSIELHSTALYAAPIDAAAQIAADGMRGVLAVARGNA
ncbi:MAG: sugar phosphate isomerase/epimerase family protein [Actinomycetota bacterium]